eukprot:gene14374-15534_t
MNIINSTSPSWVRCMKPHPVQKPLMVHGIQLLAQLRKEGVVDTLHFLRSRQFPVRLTHEVF